MDGPLSILHWAFFYSPVQNTGAWIWDKVLPKAKLCCVFNIKGTWILLSLICAALPIPLKDCRLTWISTRTSSKSKIRSDRFVLAEMGRFLLSSSSLLSGTQSMSCRGNHRGHDGGPKASGNIRIWERLYDSSQQFLQRPSDSWHKLTVTAELDTALKF